MKKYFLVVLSVCMFSLCSMSSFAAPVDATKLNVQLKVDYKNNSDEHAAERVFSTSAQLTTKRWQVIGKMLSEKNNNLMIVMAKLLQQQKNAYTIQFMLVDSNAKETVVFEPQAKIVSGVPANLSITQDGRTLDINVIAS